MKRLLLLTALVGCQTPKPIDDSAWRQALLSADRAVQSTVTSTHEVVTENTRQLEAIAQSIEAIKQATETLTDSEEVIPVSTELTQDDREEVIESANETPRELVMPQTDGTGPGVELVVTYADFYCPPCERLKAAIKAGQFSDFAIRYDNSYKPSGYPAIRYKATESSTGWSAIVGYDSGTVPFLKSRLLKKANKAAAQQVVNQMQTTWTHSDMVSIHNRLHGGGNWTWPGNLKTHLRTAHGVRF
jgi:hypothetical protein